MTAQMRTLVPAIFESDEYQDRRRNIEEEFKQRQERAFQELQEKAKELGTAVMHTPSGFAVAPTHNGEVIKPDQFKVMGQADRERIEGNVGQIQRELQDVLQAMPKMIAELRDAIQELDREYAASAVDQSIAEVEKEFGDIAEVADYLKAVREDLAKNIYVFIGSPEQMAQQGAQPQTMPAASQRDDPRLRRYMVNVMVPSTNRDRGKGAPILREENPSLGNLVGRVEHLSQMGALVTDFMLIKPGALHRANGGFLLVDARKLLLQPFAWEALKRSLKNSQIKIESASDYVGMFSTVTLEPEPIPLDIKVVLFGEHLLYYLLAANDPEFGEHFKIEAEFDDVLPRERNAETQYAAWLGDLARVNDVRALDPAGVAAVIDHSARMVSDTMRLSLKGERIADLLREADYWAGKDGSDLISGLHIHKSIEGKKRRSDRIRERQLEGIERDIIMLDTAGSQVGQINGLSVLQIGDYMFGKPSRVSASVRLGTGRVIDIEREVELGGPLHSKGVLILGGYIAARYAPGVPLAFGASLVFEQSYGGVDGDSASSTELYALLSALSEVPIRQSLAVTGSVNQHGEVQAIGGVNEKIEGFFDVCSARRLTGDQGVLVPAANVQHLMLKEEVVEACAAGKFHIYSVATIDQGIEILTGMPAGERGLDGNFPDGTVNRKVEDRLIALAEARRRFARPLDEGADSTTEVTNV
jgi:predicted ATP-dependent protease